MPYKCPLGELPQKRRYKPYNGDIIPEAITLPDGRSFRVADLTNKIKNRRSHSRLEKPRSKKTTYKATVATRYTKYTPDERRWQAVQPLNILCERYELSEGQARALRSQARQIVELLDKLDNNSVDI